MPAAGAKTVNAAATAHSLVSLIIEPSRYYARRRRRGEGRLSFVAPLRLQRGSMRPHDGGFHLQRQIAEWGKNRYNLTS
jgi:hypothetical protein